MPNHPITAVCATLQIVAGLLIAFLSSAAAAERRPVLPQIDVPHDYYFREMYLPQLTTGPSSPSWSPDGTSLVFSMRGSLWRQEIESSTAYQLTAGPGYDYQPDWSPDGKQILFVRYYRDAMELHLLELATGAVTQLTAAGAVNIEPRWAPDGTKIAFVSTQDTGRFHLFTGKLTEGSLDAKRLLVERESRIPRYYYSSFDHELSPAWSPDGAAVIYVSNPEIPYGTGAIWLRQLGSDAKPVLVRKEETSWKAKPDWSPDGKRIIYASYLGRQWHQLWITTTNGIAEPFPLTYGEFDVTSPRWSPDSRRIAYVANETGNTEIRVQEVVGGRTEVLQIEDRRYLRPMADVTIATIDANGRPTAARISVVASDGRGYAPHTSRMHADDAFDREQTAFETHYFHSDGLATVTLPTGVATVTVWHGPEHQIEQQQAVIAATRENDMTVRLRRLNLPAAWDDWVGGDVHVHMNYGGTYRNTPQHLVAQANAEDLDVVFNLIVNKEQRIPDIAYFSSEADPVSDSRVLLLHAQEFHTSFWGHLGLLGLDSHLLVPDYSAYPGTAAASLFPDNATVARLARQQNAAVGYVHPFLSPPPNPATDTTLTNALPVDVALGLVDYYEVVGFADHRASAEVWYRLLNCGFRVAAGGGTDAMANYASLRGPVGINRMYVPVPGDSDSATTRRDAWLSGLKSAHTMATNGPLLGFTANGVGPGAELALSDGEHNVRIAGFLRSAVDVDHLEIVHNGKVIKSIDLDVGRRTANVDVQVQIKRSGWLLLRAWNETSEPLVFDLYPYATTSPVFVSIGGEPTYSTQDADYFLAWIDRIRESAEAHTDYNNDAERDAIFANLRQAEKVYEGCRRGR